MEIYLAHKLNCNNLINYLIIVIKFANLETKDIYLKY